MLKLLWITMIAIVVTNLYSFGVPEIEKIVDSDRMDQAKYALKLFDSESWEYNYIMGNICYYQSELEEANKHYAKALKKSKDVNVKVYAARSEFESSSSPIGVSSRTKKYTTVLDSAFLVNPEKYAPFYTDLLPLLAVMPEMFGGNKADADRILGLLKAKTPYYYDLANACILMFQKKSAESEVKFLELVNKYPQQNLTKQYYYQLLIANKSFDKALKFSQEQNKIIDYYYYGLAAVKMEQKTDEAITLLTKYLDSEIMLSQGYVQYAEAHKNLAVLYNAKGDKTKARNEIKTAIKLRPGKKDKYQKILDEIED